MMKLIAQILDIAIFFLMIKINNILWYELIFIVRTYHQSCIAMWYHNDRNECKEKIIFDLPFNSFILSPKELILTTSSTVNQNDTSKNFWGISFSCYFQTTVKTFIMYSYSIVFIFHMISSSLISCYLSHWLIWGCYPSCFLH